MAGEIQEFTEKITALLNLDPGVYLDENKLYRLDLGQELIICYRDLHPGVYFISTLGPIPEKNRETLLMGLMHLNLFGNGTGGGVIGFDDQVKSLTLSLAVPYRVQFEEFKNHLEDFINYVEFWKSELKKVDQSEKSLVMTLN